MAEYRRFIAYLYEYVHGNKMNNHGFAKVEARNGICKIQIHLQGLAQKKSLFYVYGALRREEEWYGLRLGEGSSDAGQAQIALQTPSEHMAGSVYSLEQLCGLWLDSSEGQIFISSWEDQPVDVRHMYAYLPEEREAEQEKTEKEETEPEEADEKEAAEEEEKPEEMTAEQIEEEPDMMEIPVPELEEPDHSVQIVQRTQQLVESVLTDSSEQIFAEETMNVCKRVNPQELAVLLENVTDVRRNEFLLQGYYRYQHLLICKDVRQQIWIGVPGVYNMQEAYYAALSGFSSYKAVREKEKNGPEGYWCRMLPFPSDVSESVRRDPL